MNSIISKLQNALMEGDAQEAKESTEKGLSMGIRPKTIIQDGLMPAMKVIGDKFRENEIFIPDVLMSSRAMHASLYVLKPLLIKAKISLKGRIVIGTVAGDLHDIGKNMVSMMLEGAGYEVIDIGIDVTPEQFIEAVIKHQPDILAMSALLTTTMGELGETVSFLKEQGLRDNVKVLVGGSPVTSDFAIAIEADAYASDAYGAVDAVKRLLAGETGFFAVA